VPVAQVKRVIQQRLVVGADGPGITGMTRRGSMAGRGGVDGPACRPAIWMPPTPQSPIPRISSASVHTIRVDVAGPQLEGGEGPGDVVRPVDREVDAAQGRRYSCEYFSMASPTVGSYTTGSSPRPGGQAGPGSTGSRLRSCSCSRYTFLGQVAVLPPQLAVGPVRPCLLQCQHRGGKAPGQAEGLPVRPRLNATPRLRIGSSRTPGIAGVRVTDMLFSAMRSR